MEAPRQRLQRWHREHRGLLIKVARTYADRRSDRDDLMQEILLQLWRALPRYREESSETTFIYRVALNVALMWRRRRSRRPDEGSWTEIPETLPDRNPGRTDQRLQVAEVYRALRRLPEMDRALVLLQLEGLSYREISEVLGITESHVGVKLHRARRRLSQELED